MVKVALLNVYKAQKLIIASLAQRLPESTVNGTQNKISDVCITWQKTFLKRGLAKTSPGQLLLMERHLHFVNFHYT